MREKTKFIENAIEQDIVPENWVNFSDAFTYVQSIFETIVEKGAKSYPSTENIFRALKECDPYAVKVVILGQDVYHDGAAVGLCFDNDIAQKKISPSLRAILKEMDEDLGVKMGLQKTETNIKDPVSYLCHLPQQGVLLLNTALTVEKGKAGSHAKLWEPFTEELISDINKQRDDIVWILWGNHAKSYKKLITNETHHIIEGGHPSPLNTTVPFAGGKYFSKCNEILKALNKSPINW